MKVSTIVKALVIASVIAVQLPAQTFAKDVCPNHRGGGRRDCIENKADKSSDSQPKCPIHRGSGRRVEKCSDKK